MTQTQHTPGPLELADELMAMAGAVQAAMNSDGAALIREAAYQLRIAAAAPEFLEALQEAVQCIDPDVYPSAYRQARAAIAKAEGC